MKKLSVVGLLVMAAMNTGCVSFDTRAFDAESHAKMNQVVLITPAIPESIGVNVLAPVGRNFGLIGALATEAGLAAQRKQLTTVLSAQNYDYQLDIESSIATQLRNAGYTVSELEVSRSSKALKFLGDYSEINADYPVLDVYVSFIGYAAAGSRTEYRPTMRLAARLVQPSGEMIYSDQVFYNSLGETGEAVLLESGTDYTFEKFDMIEVDPAVTVTGLRAAITAVTTEMAGHLKK